MRNLFRILSMAGLLLVIGPPLCYLAGLLGKPSMNVLMLAGTLLWFATVPLWMGRERDEG